MGLCALLALLLLGAAAAARHELQGKRGAPVPAAPPESRDPRRGEPAAARRWELRRLQERPAHPLRRGWGSAGAGPPGFLGAAGGAGVDGAGLGSRGCEGPRPRTGERGAPAGHGECSRRFRSSRPRLPWPWGCGEQPDTGRW